MLPPCQTSCMRRLSSPGPRPSRDSHIPVTPRSGVSSSTPPMSNTTAWMVMTSMMPVAPGARSNFMKGRLLIAAGIVVIIIGGVFAAHSGCGTADPPRSDWRVLSGLLDKLGWYAATGRRLGVVMTVQRHDRPHPHIERTFTAVRAALPAANVAAFDTELEG